MLARSPTTVLLAPGHGGAHGARRELRGALSWEPWGQVDQHKQVSASHGDRLANGLGQGAVSLQGHSPGRLERMRSGLRRRLPKRRAALDTASHSSRLQRLLMASFFGCRIKGGGGARSRDGGAGPGQG